MKILEIAVDSGFAEDDAECYRFNLKKFAKTIAREAVTSALEKAYECNESNGYHNSWDIDLIVDAVVKEMK